MTSMDNKPNDTYDFLYELLKEKPFATVGEIAKGLGIGFNTAKKLLSQYHSQGKVIQLDWWTDTVYCVDDFDWPHKRMIKNFLMIRDRVIKMIYENKVICNSLAVTEFLSQFKITSIRKIPKNVFDNDLPPYPPESLLSLRDQVFLSYLHLWMLINKILLFETKRYQKNVDGISSSFLSKRNGQLLELFLEIEGFLKRHYLDPSNDYMSVSLVKELDERYEAYEHRYRQFRYGEYSLGVIIQTAYVAYLKTQKDVSQDAKISLREVHNRLEPFFDEDGNLLEKQMRMALIAESADQEILADYGDLDWLRYLIQDRRALEKLQKRLLFPKKSSKYRKLVKRLELLYPGITIDR